MSRCMHLYLNSPWHNGVDVLVCVEMHLHGAYFIDFDLLGAQHKTSVAGYSVSATVIVSPCKVCFCDVCLTSGHDSALTLCALSNLTISD